MGRSSEELSACMHIQTPPWIISSLPTRLYNLLFNSFPEIQWWPENCRVNLCFVTNLVALFEEKNKLLRNPFRHLFGINCIKYLLSMLNLFMSVWELSLITLITSWSTRCCPGLYHYSTSLTVYPCLVLNYDFSWSA